MSRLMLAVLGLSGLAAACASTTSPHLASPSAAPNVNSFAATSEPPLEVVTADELLTDSNSSWEESRIVCREMLRPASNVIQRRCMTRAGWRTYDRAQEEWARRILGQMQGSPYY